MSNCTLGVVLPTIGRIGYLDKAISSLLEQTEQFDQIVIYDNSKTQDLKSKSIHEKNTKIEWHLSGKQKPAVESWKSSLKYLATTHCMFHGDDDILDIDFVEKVKADLCKHSVVFSKYRVIDEDGKLVRQNNDGMHGVVQANEFIQKRMEGKIDLRLGGVCFSKELYESTGGLKDLGFYNYWYVDDYIWFRIVCNNGYVYIPAEINWSYRENRNWIGGVTTLDTVKESFDKYLSCLSKDLRYCFEEEKLKKYIDVYRHRKYRVWLSRALLNCVSNKSFKKFINEIKLFAKMDCDFLCKIRIIIMSIVYVIYVNAKKI